MSSSMKSFKSKISQQKKNSIHKYNASMSLSQDDYNLKNLFMNFQNRITFKIQKRNNRISVLPARLQVTNQTGVRLFVHILISKDQYFTASPNKYILENGLSYQIIINLVQLPNVQLDDYESQSFQINWGKISAEQINNKIVPQLSQSKILGCIIQNKHLVNQMITKKAIQINTRTLSNQSINRYQKDMSYMRVNDIHMQTINHQNSRLNQKDEFAKSGLNLTDVKYDTPSLLRKNIIIGVAVVSFIIGFITS